MNATEIAVYRQRCDRGEEFKAQDVEDLLDYIAALLGANSSPYHCDTEDCKCGCHGF